MKRFSLRTSGVAAVAGIALASSLLFGASTVANAQSVSLSQLVQLFISLGIIDSAHAAAAEAAVANMSSTGSTSSTMSSGYNYTRSLTVGSTGADVTALQNTLIANGDLAAGLNTGYFGALTQAAVAKWQASVGVTPASGYFGPVSIAKLNASAPAMTTTTTTTTTNNTSSTVTNTGVEGVLTVNLNPSPSSGQNVYEGDTGDALIGIKLQAQLSPITIQRVQVDLGHSTAFYTKVFSNLYLVSDTGQILAQATLNGNTVTKQTTGSTNTYYLTFSGFNYTVPGDNSVHVLTVKGDLYSSIDLTDVTNAFGNDSVPVTIDSNGIRGVDGAGVDQYGPVTPATITNSVNVNNALSSSASLQISTDPSTPLATAIVANSGSGSNEADGVTVLAIDAYAQKDNVQIDDITGTTTLTVDTHAAPTTAYLYAGSQQIGSSAISYSGNGADSTHGVFTFQNINYVVSANTTQTLTVKEDIKSADSTQVGQTTAVSASAINAENSEGDTLTSTYLTGSATGNQLTVLSEGPVFTFSGLSIDPISKTTDTSGNATSSMTVHFTLGIQAVGSALTFGNSASGTAPLIGTTTLDVYKNSVLLGTAASDAVKNLIGAGDPANIPVVTVTVPSGVAVNTTSGDGFVLGQNQTIQVPVTATIYVDSKNSGQYAVGVDSLKWGIGSNVTATLSSNFMSGLTTWRSTNTQLP